MKKFLTAILLTVTLSATSCKAQPIDFVELPKEAKTLIETYFSANEPLLIMKEYDDGKLKYEVSLTDGTTMEFFRNGEWKEISCGIESVIPDVIVPTQILSVVKQKYPKATIKKVEKGSRDIEVTLDNRVEITFDKNFRVKEIDYKG